MNPYAEGYNRASDDEATFNSCPYVFGTESHTLWIKGFIDGSQHLELINSIDLFVGSPIQGCVVPVGPEEEENLVDEF